MTDTPPRGPSPAEQRLLALLTLLRGQMDGAPSEGRVPVHAIMRTIRWQRAVRDVLRTIGQLGVAISSGITLSLGKAGRRK